MDMDMDSSLGDQLARMRIGKQTASTSFNIRKNKKKMLNVC